jgi:hypothetical protein
MSAWTLSAALALASLAWLAAAGTRLTSALSTTADEPGHLSAGLSYWSGGDYRQSTGNLFFTQKWAAWPLHHSGVRLPDQAVQGELQHRPTWIGEALLFSGAADPRAILAPARRMTLALCLLSGVLVWGLAAWLGGPWAGALAALLYATSPVVLANGVLVTTDTGTAFWYLGALAAYAWLLRRPSAIAAALAGFCAAMLALSKFSVFAWMFAAALLLGWHLWQGRGKGRIIPLVGWHCGAFAVAWLTLWAFFGWEFRPGGFAYVSLAPVTKTEYVVSCMSRWHVLPEPFLSELLTFRGIVQPRPGYLFGEFRMGGDWRYFPAAFLAKSTVAMLLALGAWLFVRRQAGTAAKAAPMGSSALAAGALAYLIIALATPINIGVRHILPLFLLAAIAGGVVLARVGRLGRMQRGLVAAIALLALIEGLSARRQPLAWFNALAGGPMSGYRIMVEASLEWGGDLPELVAWEANLRTKDAYSPVYVSLLGPPGYEHFGLPAAEMGSAFETGRVGPGYFVFGATRLVGGPWEFYGKWSETLRHAWNIYGAPSWHRPLPHRIAQLAVARLAASCRELKPTQRIGPVYFVYRLDEQALEKALGKDTTGPFPQSQNPPDRTPPAGVLQQAQ